MEGDGVNRISKRDVRVLAVVSMLLAAALGVQDAAVASHCTNSVDWDIQGEDVDRNTAPDGIRGNININNFDTAQHLSIRSVYIFAASGALAEVGWHQGHKDNPNGERVINVYWITDGVAHHEHYTSSTLTPGSTHEFKTHDADGDRIWSFAYDASGIVNHYINMYNGRAGTLSEVKCSSDNAYAHFTQLQNYMGDWTDFASLSNVVDENPNYCFDWVSKTNHYVRENGNC